MASLDELRRIIRRIETTRPPRARPEPVETVVGGHLLETEHGAIVEVRTEYPFAHRHGHYGLDGASVPRDLLALLARRDDVVPGPGRLLFLDAESTGLAGGTGTCAFLVGAAWPEDDRLVVAQYFMRDFDDEPALLAALRPLLEGASAVVTFNGTAFDLPLLETRFVLSRARWRPLPHVDLLVHSRRVWSSVLPDCRLGTLEQSVLGVLRESDVPGWEIPSRYFDYLRRRNAAPLVPIFTHNRQDVLSLVTLLGWFASALAGPRSGPPLGAEALAGVGRLLDLLGEERSLDYWRAALDAGLDGPRAHAVRLWLARAEKRRARWAAACALWEAATQVDFFDPRPWEELAKFHEHRSRNFPTAHAVVSTALGMAQEARVAPRVVEAFNHRLGRLDRRLRGAGKVAGSPPDAPA